VARIQAFRPEQGAETREHGFGLIAHALDRIHRVEALAEAGDVENCLGVVTRCVGKDDLAPRQAAQGVNHRALEDDHAPQVGKLVGFPQEVVGVGTVMTGEAEQRGAVAHPVILPDAGCFVRIDAEMALIERLM